MSVEIYKLLWAYKLRRRNFILNCCIWMCLVLRLFGNRPPEGEVRTTCYDVRCPKRFSWHDLCDGTFLPLAFYRTSNGCWAWNRCVSKYMTSTLAQGCVDAWSFGHHVNPYGNETDWKTDKRCDAHTLRSRHSPCEFMPIRAVYVDKK